MAFEDLNRRAWFKSPGFLMAAALGAGASALTGAAVGIASARTDGSPQPASHGVGALSVIMQLPRELNMPAKPIRMATLDPAALRDQSTTAFSSDPEGDENLRIIDAQERRLQAMNDREAAAFAAQMRQTQAEDGTMAREVRTSVDAPVSPAGYATSNSTGVD